MPSWQKKVSYQQPKDLNRPMLGYILHQPFSYSFLVYSYRIYCSNSFLHTQELHQTGLHSSSWPPALVYRAAPRHHISTNKTTTLYRRNVYYRPSPIGVLQRHLRARHQHITRHYNTIITSEVVLNSRTFSVLTIIWNKLAYTQDKVINHLTFVHAS